MAKQLPIKRLVVVGLIASVVMGMFEMMAEALFGSEGFWAPVIYIAATVLRDYQTIDPDPGFIALPVLLGLMAHMMNSVVLGLGFAAVVRDRIEGVVPRLVAGMVFGSVVFAMMWYVVLPLVDDVMLRLSAGVFFVAHLMWGVALGLLNAPETANAPARKVATKAPVAPRRA